MRACLAGLDAVMVLELDDEALAVKRALGRRVDPLTGRVYHLEFDAPPPKEPGLAARLKVTSFPFCSLASSGSPSCTDRLSTLLQYV